MDAETVAAQMNGFVKIYLLPFGWKLIGAVAVWIVGGWIIGLLRAGLRRFLQGRHIDATLSRYLDATATIALKIFVVIAMLGVMGIETTSFAALIAAVGVAIGAAWAGLLSNFAAGIFLMVLRPFKIGDAISGAGVVGVVREIGLFVTAIDTADNVRTFVGNAKLFADNIQNYSANPFRRVDLSMQLAHSVDPKEAAARVRARLARVPNVLSAPAPDVEILTFTAMGAVLAVRPYCDPNNYWQVYFDTNQAIVEVGAEAGYEAPETRHTVRTAAVI